MITNSILAIAFMYGCYKLSRFLVKCDEFANEHKKEMLLERNNQVCLFRKNMIYAFGAKVCECMVSYDEMLLSNKPLTAAEWVDVDKLTSIGNEIGSEVDFRPFIPVNVVFINPN